MKHVTLWGDDWDSMLGVILFNYGLAMAIPAWLSEKKKNVQVSTIIHGSTILSTLLYVSVGVLGAMAIPNVNANMLEPMVSGAYGSSIRIGASFFAFFIIGLDIPLFSVLTRYNLTNSRLCSTRVANFLVVYMPWGIAWIFYQGSAIDELLSWGRILFTSVSAFLLPLYLAVRVLQRSDSPKGSVQVYGKWFRTRRSELCATKIILGLMTVCVFAAIVGQIFDEMETEWIHNGSTSTSLRTAQSLRANASVGVVGDIV